jgi:fluoride ion exporter CrcB/FEX
MSWAPTFFIAFLGKFYLKYMTMVTSRVSVTVWVKTHVVHGVMNGFCPHSLMQLSVCTLHRCLVVCRCTFLKRMFF